MSNATFDMGLFTAPDRGDIFRHVILINDAQLVAFDLKTLITKKKSEATREELASAYVPGTLDRYCRKLILAAFHLQTLKYQPLDISLPERVHCTACNGTGIDPVYEDRCSVCNGLRYSWGSKDEPISVLGLRVSANLLLRVIDQPGIKFALDEEPERAPAVAFNFGGYYGLIASLVDGGDA